MCRLFTFIQTSHIISVEYRKALHEALVLDLTRPYFRRGNAVKFDTQENEVLINPHRALSHKGIYTYLKICHYLKSLCNFNILA